ncbi:hypothetical protein Tco_0899928 [Tanacetum coccineum]
MRILRRRIKRKGMDIKELSKFYDATLSKVLKKVEEINVEASYGSKDTPLSKEDKEFMKFFEEEIKECLKHRRQMMRWESYVRIFQISHEEGQNGTKTNTRMKEREKPRPKNDDARNDAFGSHAGNPKANHWLIMRGGHSTVKMKAVMSRWL